MHLLPIIAAIILVTISASASFTDYNLYRIFGPKRTDGVDQGGQSQVLKLLEFVTQRYLHQCSLVVLYHSSFRFQTKTANFDLRSLFSTIRVPFAHGLVTRDNKVPEALLNPPDNSCRGYLIFVKDISSLINIIGYQSISKVVVITSSTRWTLEEFLQGTEARNVVNLLIVTTTGASDIILKRGEKSRSERFLNMYTHEIYHDAAGGSSVRFVASWRNNQLSKNVTLFPAKMARGFNGRRFAIVASEQPPFVIKKQIKLLEDANESEIWDGIELRLIRLISQFLNYTIEITEADPLTKLNGSSEAVISAVMAGTAEIGVAGVYKTIGHLDDVSMSVAHSVDCAAFLTRTSTALPRYRAILGPFHWSVWLALTLTYFLAILPLTFAEKHSLSFLLDHPWQLETMFWYVFGTFTNCFTFRGENTWTHSEKNASRILIGSYWSFSIIITACYTGSIIAFITLFVFPPVIDTTDQLLDKNYRVGVLGAGGWNSWFNNSEHPQTKWLLRDVQVVENLWEGIRNVTGSFYLPLLRPYAFLGGRAQLDYTLKTNYTNVNKKDVLHVSRDCFVPFSVSIIYPDNAPYVHIFNEYILRAQQSGIMAKIFNDMQWELQRSSTGKFLQVGSGTPLREAVSSDRQLTLDDTQGMFLLLGGGFLMAIAALASEMSGHHTVSGGSWRIWRWKPRQTWGRIRLCFNKYVDYWFPRLDDRESSAKDGFTYKTYDSRLLNSQHHGIEPTCFRSQSFFMHNEGTLERTTSLPDLSLLVPEQLAAKSSSSCNDIRHHNSSENPDLKTPQCQSPDAFAIKFGSLGSVLRYDCTSALTQKYLDDRPQTGGP